LQALTNPTALIRGHVLFWLTFSLSLLAAAELVTASAVGMCR
jgi:hypothetical protein